jgi:glycosyltransferase involved in cell wall biosynthesis
MVSAFMNQVNQSRLKRKIIFVTHLFYPACGGVETHLTRLAGALASRGFQVKVLTTDAFSTEAFFLNDKRRIEKKAEVMDGVEIERLGFQTWGRLTLNLLRSLACRLKYPCNNWIRFYSFGPRNSLFLKKILQYRPDIIFAAPLPTFNIYYAWKAAKKLKVPLIINPAYHIHDPCSYDNQIFFKIMREAQLVAVHSEREKEHIAQEGKINPQKIFVFPPLPFQKQDFLPRRAAQLSKEENKKKYGIKEKYVLLFLGQHGRHKNIAEIMKAMGPVWRHVPDTALVIAGGTTAYTPHLKKAASEYNQSSRQKIYFIDDFAPEEKDNIYNMADIFISLSDFESFGIVLVEAMLHKIPVIASLFSIAGSIVDDLQTGLLVNPYCDVEVSGAALELLLDEKIRTAYGENGRRKVFKEYHPEKILNKWEKNLERLS